MGAVKNREKLASDRIAKAIFLMTSTSTHTGGSGEEGMSFRRLPFNVNQNQPTAH
jgi:hypothetical protein